MLRVKRQNVAAIYFFVLYLDKFVLRLYLVTGERQTTMPNTDLFAIRLISQVDIIKSYTYTYKVSYNKCIFVCPFYFYFTLSFLCLVVMHIPNMRDKFRKFWHVSRYYYNAFRHSIVTTIKTYFWKEQSKHAGISTRFTLWDFVSCLAPAILSPGDD